MRWQQSYLDAVAPTVVGRLNICSSSLGPNRLEVLEPGISMSQQMSRVIAFDVAVMAQKVKVVNKDQCTAVVN